MTGKREKQAQDKDIDVAETPVKSKKSKVAPSDASTPAEVLKALKVDALKAKLEEQGLSTAGNKADLIARLLKSPLKDALIEIDSPVDEAEVHARSS